MCVGGGGQRLFHFVVLNGEFFCFFRGRSGGELRHTYGDFERGRSYFFSAVKFRKSHLLVVIIRLK